MDTENGGFGGVKVLVADDTQLAQIALKSMLEDLGYGVATASNGQEAVNRFDPSFDVIFMDYNMPEMNGDEATKAIRQKEKDYGKEKSTYIIGLTANNSEQVNNSYYKAGINDVIEKPINQQKLKKILCALNLQN